MSVFNKPEPQLPKSKPLSERYALHKEEVEQLEHRIHDLEEKLNEANQRVAVAEKIFHELKAEYEKNDVRRQNELNRTLDERDRFQKAFAISDARFEAIRHIVYDNDKINKEIVPPQVMQKLEQEIVPQS